MIGYGFKFEEHFYLCENQDIANEFVELATGYSPDIDASKIKIQSVTIDDDNYFYYSPVKQLGVGVPNETTSYMNKVLNPPPLSSAEQAFSQARAELLRRYRFNGLKTSISSGSSTHSSQEKVANEDESRNSPKGCIVPMVLALGSIVDFIYEILK